MLAIILPLRAHSHGGGDHSHPPAGDAPSSGGYNSSLGEYRPQAPPSSSPIRFGGGSQSENVLNPPPQLEPPRTELKKPTLMATPANILMSDFLKPSHPFPEAIAEAGPMPGTGKPRSAVSQNIMQEVLAQKRLLQLFNRQHQ